MLLAVVLAAGCDAAAPHPRPRPTTGVARPAGTAASPGPSPTFVRAAAITLTADLGERPATWDQVLFVPFGDSDDQVQYWPAQEFPTREPTSFAVAGDGSFWIMDVVKHRLLHLSRDGSFIEQRAGYSMFSQDVQVVGADVHSIVHNQFAKLRLLRPDGTSQDSRLRSDGKSLFVSELIPTPAGVVVRIPGFTFDIGKGPNGFFSLPTGPGDLDIGPPLPGIPLGPGRWFRLSAPGDQDLAADFITPLETLEQPIHVEITGPGGSVPGVVGAGKYVVVDRDVAMYVKIVAYLPGGRQVGLRYLLRVGSSPMLWERLPNPDRIDDDTQWRCLSLGPDGQLYLMVTDHDGIRIYRRPS